MIINFKLLYKDSLLPTFANKDHLNAGMDFYAHNEAFNLGDGNREHRMVIPPEGLSLFPGASVIIGTGVAWEPRMLLKEEGALWYPVGIDGDLNKGIAGWQGSGLKPVLMIQSRSGRAFKDQVEASNAGVVDALYRGEIHVLLYNHGKRCVKILKGDRIAQGVAQLLPLVTIGEAEELEPTSRGRAGFGSSGN